MIYIGDKNIKNYLLALYIEYKNNNNKCALQARGKYIQKACEVANKFIKKNKTFLYNCSLNLEPLEITIYFRENAR